MISLPFFEPFFSVQYLLTSEGGKVKFEKNISKDGFHYTSRMLTSITIFPFLSWSCGWQIAIGSHQRGITCTVHPIAMVLLLFHVHPLQVEVGPVFRLVLVVHGLVFDLNAALFLSLLPPALPRPAPRPLAPLPVP